MQNIPILRQGREGTELQIIRSSDIIKIERLRHHEYRVHTRDEQHILDMSLETLEEWLYEEGFRLIDRNNLVNIHHIADHDLLKGKVYFGDPAQSDTLSASVARSQYKHLETLLRLRQLPPEEAIREVMDAVPEAGQAVTELNSEERKFQRSYHTLLSVAERQRTESRIWRMAFHDALTGLPNRLLLQERMKEAFEQAKTSQLLSAVMFIDLDRIKVINDTLGHHAGDQVLIHWATCMSAFTAPHGITARFSGDEFIILLPDAKSTDFVAKIAAGLLKLFETPFVYGHHDLFSTASIGIAMYPTDGDDPETLLKFADSAMYKAKGKGGNAFEFYSSDKNERSLDRLSLEIDLRKSVDRRELLLHYQPIVDLGTGRMVGMESLIRWKHPQRGLVPPGQFIPLAEETGMIVPIGRWVLEEACRQTREWQLIGMPQVRVSVNISVIQFQQPDFVDSVREALDRSGLPAEMLCLEITENIAMTNVQTVIRTINELRELGVALSIDDFGTGYSSLSYLKRFRVHTLKIDRSFIQEVTTDEESAAIVTALIAMSKRLNIRSLAEGVETREQVEFLIEHGCNEIQGFWFSKPLPAPEFEVLLCKGCDFLGAFPSSGKD